MLSYPFAETFTVLSSAVTGQDSYGDDVRTDTSTTTTGVFAPEGSTEVVQGRDLVINNPTVYLSADAVTPAATDRIRRESTGEVFNIDGQPAVYINPFTGERPGAVLRLERVTG